MHAIDYIQACGQCMTFLGEKYSSHDCDISTGLKVKLESINSKLGAKQ